MLIILNKRKLAFAILFVFCSNLSDSFADFSTIKSKVKKHYAEWVEKRHRAQALADQAKAKAKGIKIAQKLMNDSDANKVAEVLKVINKLTSPCTTCPTNQLNKILLDTSIDGRSPFQAIVSQWAKTGDGSIIQELLKQGFNLDATFGEKTPLSIALAEKNPDAVSTILALHPDAQLTGYLEEVFELGNADILNRVLSSRRPPPQSELRRVAGKMIQNGALNDPSKLSLAQALLDHMKDINAKNESGETLLHEAARTGSPELVALLLEKKSNPNLASPFSGTALATAADGLQFRKESSEYKRALDVMKLLTPKTKDLNALVPKPFSRDFHDMFDHICRYGDTDLVSHFIEHGSKPSQLALIHYLGNVGLKDSISQKDESLGLKLIEKSPKGSIGPELVQVLSSLPSEKLQAALLKTFTKEQLNKGFKNPGNEKYKDSELTPLEATIISQKKMSKDLLEAFLKAGSDLNLTKHDPVTLALRHGQTELAELIAKRPEYSSKLNQFDHHTALMEAIATDNEKIVKVLLDRGFHPDGVEGAMLTPLALAALDGKKDIVKLLLAQKADPNKKGKLGYTVRSILLGANDIPHKKELCVLFKVEPCHVVSSEPPKIDLGNFFAQKKKEHQELENFDFDHVHQQVKLRPPKPFRQMNLEALLEAKKQYLARPEIKKLSCEKLGSLFEERFPVRGPCLLPKEHHLDKGFLIDQDTFEEIPMNKARTGIKTVQNYCSSSKDVGVLYSMRKVLEAIDKDPSPEKINRTLILLASAGQHCTAGQTESWDTLKKEFISKEPGEENEEPATLNEFVRSVLDDERERQFSMAKEFEDDAETASTNSVLRSDVSLAKKLGISPEKRIPYWNYYYRSPEYNDYLAQKDPSKKRKSDWSINRLKKEVESNFYGGRILNGKPEAGYIAANAALALSVKLSENAPFRDAAIEELKNKLESFGLTDEKLRALAKKDNKIYQSIMYSEPSDEAELHEFVDDLESSDLREAYVRAYLLDHVEKGGHPPKDIFNHYGISAILYATDQAELNHGVMSLPGLEVK